MEYMKYLLIRHGKTNANRMTRAAYGKQGAPLNDEGIEQAKALHWELMKRGVTLSNEPVAVSELLRARQTAKVAGLKNIVTNSLLNEVNTSEPQNTTKDLRKGVLAPEAITAAKNSLLIRQKREYGLLTASSLQRFLPSSNNWMPTNSCQISAK